MDTLFCCSSIQPFKPQRLSHETKFKTFMQQTTAPFTTASKTTNIGELLARNTSYVVQVVRQVNYGPVEWKKFFAYDNSSFHEVSENDLIEANYQKLNSYKNFKCTSHNKFFELNIYEKDPVNAHHWRANIARPAGDIDLPISTVATSTPTTTNPEPKVASDLGEVDSKPKDVKDVAGDSPTNPSKHVSTALSTDNVSDITSTLQALQHDRNEPDDDYDTLEYGGDRYDSESEKDFTACSSNDCGNCGHCDY